MSAPPRLYWFVASMTVLGLAVGCAKARPVLFDRDRGMPNQPISKQSRQELLDGHLLAGINHLRDEDLGAARLAFEQHLKAKPRSALAHYHLGLIAMDEDKFEPARQHLERALKLQPKLHGAASNLGVLYLRHGEDAAAMRRLEEAEAMEPTDPRVTVNLANARLRRGLWSEAVESYREARKAVPGHSSMMYNEAVALHARHRYAAALQLLDEAILHRPGFQRARALKVSCLQGAGKVQEALAFAKTSLESVEPSADLEVVHGRALLAAGRIDEGVDALERAVELDDTDPNALLALGEVLDATNHKKRARSLYRKFLRLPIRDLRDSRRVRQRLKSLQNISPG